MYHGLQRAPGTRAVAIAVALAAHALLLVLLLWMERHAPLRESPGTSFAGSIWIQLAPLPPEERQPELQPEPQLEPDPAPQPATPPRPIPLPPRDESTAITLPAPPAEPAEPASPETPPTAPGIDWYSESRTTAARLAAAAAEAGKSQGFSPAPEALRKPCKQRDFYDPEVGARMDELQPRPPEPPTLAQAADTGGLMVGTVRVGMLNLFSMGVGGRPAPRADLFDESKAGKRPTSSVPDTETCD